MSHFTVLVVGDDIDGQLAPYHEFECTGQNDEYVQDVDVTAESIENGLDWYGLGGKRITSMDDLDLEETHKYGYALIDADGKLIKAVNRTNPNAQWDWYTIGGRWANFFDLKSGIDSMDSNRDSALLIDIDVEGMRNAAQLKASSDWNKAHEAAGGTTWISWDHTREVLYPGEIDAAREFYNAQPAVSAITQALNIWGNPDEFLTPHDEYVQAARNSALSTYALVQDGKWFSKGKMGWWGFSNDELTQAEWDEQINALIDHLPPDTRLTVVDCHI